MQRPGPSNPGGAVKLEEPDRRTLLCEAEAGSIRGIHDLTCIKLQRCHRVPSILGCSAFPPGRLGDKGRAGRGAAIRNGITCRAAPYRRPFEGADTTRIVEGHMAVLHTGLVEPSQPCSVRLCRMRTLVGPGFSAPSSAHHAGSGMPASRLSQSTSRSTAFFRALRLGRMKK